jgi:hypothetical protein
VVFQRKLISVSRSSTSKGQISERAESRGEHENDGDRSKALNAVNAILKRDNTGVVAESAGAAQLRPSCVSPTPQLKRE